MAPKLLSRDPMDANDSSPDNQEVSTSRGRGQGRGRGRGRSHGHGRGGRGSRRHEEASASSSPLPMHEPGGDFLVKLLKLRRWINLADSFA